MFCIISRDDETGKFGVLDTEDFVVEFYDLEELKRIRGMKIPIEGIYHLGKNWDIVLQKCVIPNNLFLKIADASFKLTKSVRGQSDYRKIMVWHFESLQRKGENLFLLGERVATEDLLSLDCIKRC